MGIKNTLTSLVDGYREIFHPESLVKVKAARSALSYKHGKNRRLGPQSQAGKGSGDAHMASTEMTILREQVRQLDRDNYIAKSVMDRMLDCILGVGIKLQVSTGNKRVDALTEKLWEEYWGGSPEIRGLCNGQALERIILRSRKIDGDILIVRISNGSIQLIESDQIRTPSSLRSDRNVINGVRVDAFGRPVEFYVFPHEDAAMQHNQDINKAAVIRAEDCIFVAERSRISMTRGVSAFASCIDLFDDIDGFIEASVIQQKVSASHVMVIEQKGGPDILDTETAYDSKGRSMQVEETRPGSTLYLDVGESAKVLGAQQSGQQFGPFVTQMLRFVGLPFGMPLEITSMDFSKTNFSSARASLQLADKNFKREHNVMVREVLEKIFFWFLEDQIRIGNLPERKYKINAVPPKMISVDPLKEIKAEIEKIGAGLSTLRDSAHADGKEWDEIMDQRQTEIMLASKIASNIVNSTGEDYSSRDILGTNVKFKPEIFQDEQQVANPSTE